jgi:hypothetical protein
MGLLHVRKAWRNKLSTSMHGGDRQIPAVLKAYLLTSMCVGTHTS